MSAPTEMKTAAGAAEFGTTLGHKEHTAVAADQQSPGVVGMRHYELLFGERKQVRPAQYALLDHRADGSPRIVDTFVDPSAALTAAELLRAAGSTIEIVLISAVDPL